MCIYIYIYVYIHTHYVYIYIYIYIHSCKSLRSTPLSAPATRLRQNSALLPSGIPSLGDDASHRKGIIIIIITIIIIIIMIIIIITIV